MIYEVRGKPAILAARFTDETRAQSEPCHLADLQAGRPASGSTDIGGQLREAWISVTGDLENRQLKKSLAVANNPAARYALNVGEKEIQSPSYVWRDWTTAKQPELEESEPINTLKR